MSVNTALLGDETSKILKCVTYFKIVEMIQLDQQYEDVSKGWRSIPAKCRINQEFNANMEDRPNFSRM